LTKESKQSLSGLAIVIIDYDYALAKLHIIQSNLPFKYADYEYWIIGFRALIVFIAYVLITPD